MRSRGGTLRAQWLGKGLRDLRESAGLSLKKAGDHLIRDQSTISRMETGSLPARLSDVRELMNLYGVTDPELRTGLEALTRDIWIKGWWDDFAADLHVRVVDLAWLEARSEELRSFNLPVLHGLLQTPEYAEAVMRTMDPEASDSQIARWIEFRMKRQEVLDRLSCTAILDETLFHRPFGGTRVMHDQLAHLLDISERPNLTIRVLPYRAGTLAGPEGGFTLLTMPAPFPVVAQVTTEAGTSYLEMPKAARFEATYLRLHHHALDAEESRVFIKTRMGQFS
jgi:transcriptional regulator with XRE-family HTH domain